MQQTDALPKAHSFADAARNGLDFYAKLQLDDGHWACSYTGPSFLLPGIVYALYITNYDIPREWATEMVRWICHHQNDDGGWGLHTYGASNVNAIVLYYVALRILGMPASDLVGVRARQCLSDMGKSISVINTRSVD
jgi:lanosterol synthase